MEPRRLRLRHGLLTALLLGGCAAEEYDRTDLQFDVDAPLPAAAETLHVCVSGTGTLDLGAGLGRAAFTGILAGTGVTVTVNVLDADGVVLGEATGALDEATPYLSAPWVEGAATPCTDPGRRAPDTAETWLLGVRFQEAAWS